MYIICYVLDMSNTVKTSVPYFRLMKRSKNKEKVFLINNMTKTQMNVLSEIVLNTLYGSIPLNKNTIEKMKKKSTLKQIIMKRISLKTKKHLLLESLSLVDTILGMALRYI